MGLQICDPNYDNHRFFTFLEFDEDHEDFVQVQIDYYEPYHPAKTDDEPDRCYPEEGPYVEFTVTLDDGEEISYQSLSRVMIDDLNEACIRFMETAKDWY